MALLKPEEVAEELSVELSWVYSNWKRLKLPFKKIGQQLRMRSEDLSLWLEAR